MTKTGNHLDIGNIHRTFYKLSEQTGLRAPGASHGPRLHVRALLIAEFLNETETGRGVTARSRSLRLTAIC